MDLSIAISIVGAFISLLLMVNAFFIKELVKSINEVKLELMKLTTSHDNTSKDVEDNSEDIKDLYKTINSLRDRLNKIEGEMNHLQQ